MTSHSFPHPEGRSISPGVSNQEPRIHPGSCPLCCGSRPRALVTSMLTPSQDDSLGEKALCPRGPGTLTPLIESHLCNGPREQQTLSHFPSCESQVSPSGRQGRGRRAREVGWAWGEVLIEARPLALLNLSGMSPHL